MGIPFLDLASAHRTLADEILAAWKRILEQGQFIGGSEVDTFEREFAAYARSPHCVGVANGTDALRFALIALGLRADDEVITVPHTFIATTEAITQAGGVPVFVDVDADSGTMDPRLVERAITRRTRFLLPVHLYGQMADMDPLLDIANRRELQIVEDACQAHGAEYYGRRAGSLGAAAAFSFYPGKNLGACGEAGAVACVDPDVAARVRELRDHGQAQKYHHRVEGYNGRLDALQAAALRIKLRHVEDWTEARRRHAAAYEAMLDGSSIEVQRELPGRRHVRHLYVIRHPERDRLRVALGDAQIGSGMHYPVPLHLQLPYRHMKHTAGTFPQSERWADFGISLPMFPELQGHQIAHVCEVLRRTVE